MYDERELFYLQLVLLFSLSLQRTKKKCKEAFSPFFSSSFLSTLFLQILPNASSDSQGYTYMIRRKERNKIWSISILRVRDKVDIDFYVSYFKKIHFIIYFYTLSWKMTLKCVYSYVRYTYFFVEQIQQGNRFNGHQIYIYNLTRPKT